MGWFDKALGAVGGILGFGQGQQNLAFQKENLDYQKQLQQQIFNREDTAVQRRAADLEKAGLSKTLAAGSAAGAGSVIPTSAPQSDTMSRVIEGIGLRKAMADAKLVEAQASNEVKRGQEIDSNVSKNLEQSALFKAQQILTYGRSEFLGIESNKADAFIAEANARTKKILKDMGYTDKQIEYTQSLINNMDIKTSISAKELSMMETQRNILEGQLAGILLDNDMKYYENYYTASNGMKMGTGGWVGSLAGAVGYQVGRASDSVVNWWRNR